ncbi:hypothetical protein PTTG_26757 [Puccinia triticina 1-1 BBBD Race 1]|uniref:Uncharacterized protein n=1 Tax=Puccinia triticina (isolate 1-1 / race 1 (BBBD)) TaxID=630390 RepID=A0A180GQI9_PUCT1|nr:hypothetical protein PTTG_26757 [Puccinia triticina 1-1 BBBD Race 1]
MVKEMVKQTNKRLNRTPEIQVEAPIEESQRGLPISTIDPTRDPTTTQENLSREAPGKEIALGHNTDSEDSFKEILNPSKDGLDRDTAATYKAILSNLPLIVKPGAVSVTEPPKELNAVSSTAAVVINSLTTPEVTTIVKVKAMQEKTDHQEIWERATEAFAKGDKKSTDFFLRLYGKMDNATSLNAPDKPDILRSSSSDAINPAVNVAKRSADKTTIVFIKGSLPNHFNVGFTPYFNRNIREFRGPIPLTIFDKNWQRDAIHYYTNRRSKGDEKDGNYIGYKYPNEWTQTFSKWKTNHQNFYITFKDMYGYTEFANWILLHKENVDKIIGEEGFMTAFQYDMIIHQNAFSYQVTTSSGEISAVDILIFREELGYDLNTSKQRVKSNKPVEDHAKPESTSNCGRGGYRRRGDRWGQDRQNSDYGGYGDYHHEEPFNKRPRDHGYNDSQYNGGNNYCGHQGGYNRERGGYRGEQGPSRGFKKKDNTSSAKGKDT